MTVSVLLSKTLHGSEQNDNLVGLGLGWDMGALTNSIYAPIVDQSANSGQLDVYINHNGASLISAVQFYIRPYGEGTLYAYGGAATAAADFITLSNLGANSGTSKNNGDGLSGGLWIDQRWNSNNTTRFDRATYPTKVHAFGGAGQGLSAATALPLITDAMVYNSSGETAASAPVAGEIGPSGSSTLGDSAHIQMRMYLPTLFTNQGYIQFEFVISYDFSS